MLSHRWLLLSLLIVTQVSAQSDTVWLANPSFEANFVSFSGDSVGWTDCGFLSEGPATYQPGQFDVSLAAADKRNYISMVVRDNYTWDAVGQKLTTPLRAGVCYKITIQLAQARSFIASSRRHEGRVKYTNPLRLLLWGGTGFCQAGQLLAETDLVKNKNWELYTFYFRPEREVTHLTLHAYYLNPMAPAYNGHILMDNASPIVAIPCESAPISTSPDQNPIALTPQSVDELKRYIALHGRNIVFQPGKYELEEKPSEGYYNPRYWSYAHFSVIVKGLNWFPERKLVLVVKDKPRRLLQGRLRYLEQFAYSRGLSPMQFVVRAYDKVLDKKADWTARSGDLWIRLE